jgi:DnaJ-class molecular chaperone
MKKIFKVCEACEGTGSVKNYGDYWNTTTIYYLTTCSVCNGTGKILWGFIDEYDCFSENGEDRYAKETN